MRQYVKQTVGRWGEFQTSHPEVAGKLRDMILSVCGDMTSNGSKASRKKQIGAMLQSGQFQSLRELALEHAKELGIRENTDVELALWIRTICFCQLAE